MSDLELAAANARAQSKALMASTTKEWMDIYIELIEATLKATERQSGRNPEAFSEFTTAVRPRLRRIATRLDAYGLSLTDEIDIEGMTFEPPNKIGWDNPNRPTTTLIWPDGQSVTFVGDEATSCAAFLMWWQSMQAGLFAERGLQLGILGKNEVRTLGPGDPDYENYRKAKEADLRSQGGGT